MISTLCLMAFSLVMLARGCDLTPGPTPDGDKIAVDSPHVLICSGPDVTEQQGQAIDSTKINQWCESNNVQLKKVDVRDDLSLVEPIWRQLRDRVSNPPAMVIATPRRTAVWPVDSLKQVLQDLEAETR